MGDIIKTNENQLVTLLHNTGVSKINRPFENDILLFETYIAGTTYVPNFKAIEPLICIDDELTLLRETDNGYDSNAIRVNNAEGAKLGYIPVRDNLVAARLMDAGKLLFGKVVKKKKRGQWDFIAIEVYLRD